MTLLSLLYLVVFFFFTLHCSFFFCSAYATVCTLFFFSFKYFFHLRTVIELGNIITMPWSPPLPFFSLTLPPYLSVHVTLCRRGWLLYLFSTAFHSISPIPAVHTTTSSTPPTTTTAKVREEAWRHDVCNHDNFHHHLPFPSHQTTTIAFASYHTVLYCTILYCTVLQSILFTFYSSCFSSCFASPHSFNSNSLSFILLLRSLSHRHCSFLLLHFLPLCLFLAFLFSCALSFFSLIPSLALYYLSLLFFYATFSLYPLTYHHHQAYLASWNIYSWREWLLTGDPEVGPHNGWYISFPGGILVRRCSSSS